MSENRRGDIFDPHCTADNSQRSWLSMPHHRNKVSGKGWGKSSSPFPSLPCLAFPIPDPPSYLSFPFTFPYSPFCFLSSCLPHFYSHSRQGTEKRISSSNVFQYENPASGVHSEWVSEQCFTSPPTQYRLYGRRFLQVKRPNQQYQSTEGRSTKDKEDKKAVLSQRDDRAMRAISRSWAVAEIWPFAYLGGVWNPHFRVEGEVVGGQR